MSFVGFKGCALLRQVVITVVNIGDVRAYSVADEAFGDVWGTAFPAAQGTAEIAPQIMQYPSACVA